MSDSNQMYERTHNSFATLMYGMMLGAGAVAVGILVMKDKNNQEKVSDAVTMVKDGINDYVDDAKTKVAKVKKDLE